MQITRGRAETRIHVTDPFDWNRVLGTDYWAFFGPESITSATGRLLSDQGWTTASLAETAGTGADFLSSADEENPAHVLTNASGDLLQSPSVFGDYIHAQAAAKILGRDITRMVVEWYGAMTVRTANEVISGWGLVEAGGSPATGDDHMAWIWVAGGVGDAFHFEYANGTGDDTGAAADTSWHAFKIVGTLGGTWEWFIDGVSQGTLAIQTDLFPVSFGMHAFTTNRPALSWLHIWYE